MKSHEFGNRLKSQMFSDYYNMLHTLFNERNPGERRKLIPFA